MAGLYEHFQLHNLNKVDGHSWALMECCATLILK